MREGAERAIKRYCHHRPESVEEWRTDLDKLPHYSLFGGKDFHQNTGYQCGVFIFIKDAEKLIDNHIAAAEQRGYERGLQDGKSQQV